MTEEINMVFPDFAVMPSYLNSSRNNMKDDEILNSVWKDFESGGAIEKVTKKEMPEIVRLLQEAITMLAAGFIACEIRDNTKVNKVIMGLMSNNFVTLKCSVDLASHGYYMQSMNLLRIVHENLIACYYLKEKPEEVSLWLNYNKGNRPPGHATMLNQLGKTKAEKEDLRELYQLLCAFSHTNSLKVHPHLYKSNVNFGSPYNKELFKMSTFLICKMAKQALSFISQWVPDVDQWHKAKEIIVYDIDEFADQMEKVFQLEGKKITE
jgi:hypothetical protein